MGNIVGTNLVNILFILGLSALIRPITFDRLTLRFDLPAMTAASLALWLLALDGSLARVDGIVLCLAGIADTVGIVWTSRQEPEAVTGGVSCGLVRLEQLPHCCRPLRRERCHGREPLGRYHGRGAFACLQATAGW